MDDQSGILKEGFGGYLRKRHQLEMVDCRDANGNSPLSEAAAGGHQSTILMLTEKGADVNSRYVRTVIWYFSFQKWWKVRLKFAVLRLFFSKVITYLTKKPMAKNVKT